MSWLDQPRTLEIASAALPKWRDECLFTVSRLKGTEKLGRLYDYSVEIATKDPGVRWGGRHFISLLSALQVDPPNCGWCFSK